jgi:sugar/nucleoside kinase (ribokinase family)
MLNNSESYRCQLLGCIGDDDYGKRLQQELDKSGVVPLLEINKENLTSRCAVGVYQKERCLVPQIRASTHLSNDFVEKNLVEFFLI